MIHYKTAQEIQVIKESAQILGKAHAEVAKAIKPGVKTKDLDKNCGSVYTRPWRVAIVQELSRVSFGTMYIG